MQTTRSHAHISMRASTHEYTARRGCGRSAVIASHFSRGGWRRRTMKTLGVSFAVGLLVGALYGVIRVKSPAPPIVALLGLLGMVLGEQLGGWILTKNVSVTHAASVCLVGKHWDQRANVQSVVSVQPR